MKEEFRSKNFGSDALARIKFCDEIIRDYSQQGYRLTLRQLYYQLVTKNIVPNTEKSYKNLSTLVSDARLAGLLDWHAIEDRGRQPHSPLEFSSLEHRVQVAMDNFRLPRWRGQEVYAELWVEKDALAGVLSPLASKHHVTLMVNKGYSSQSAMYESANRFKEELSETVDDNERHGRLFYLGDLDPSGEDMVRDITDRMEMFGVENLTVQKIALTMDQVKKYKPPPNPAKVTDPRAAAYIAKYGNSSWEVDALPPTVLGSLINAALTSVIDQDQLQKILAEEQQDRTALQKALKSVKRADKVLPVDTSKHKDDPRKANWPSGLIGVIDMHSSGFICVHCMTGDEDIDDENDFIRVMATDDWAEREVPPCRECRTFPESVIPV